MVFDLNQPPLPCTRGAVVVDGGDERAGRSDVGCENLYHIDMNCSPPDSEGYRRGEDGNSSGRASSGVHINQTRDEVSNVNAGNPRQRFNIPSSSSFVVQSSDVDDMNVLRANFPIQFEDFYLISVGAIDSRPTYHDRNQIWPVGYKSMWHDKITGSLFEFDITDGGDSGPDFMLRRYPCRMQTIPVVSSVISSKKMASRIGACDEDDRLSLQTMLTENLAPCLNDEIRLNEDGLVNLVVSNLDSVGDFGVQGRSLSSLWENCCRSFFDALYEVYNRTHAIQVGCEHDYGNYVEQLPDLLSKFSSSTGPIGTLHAINGDNEFRSACEHVKKWLQADRFGLDADFVQKIIEQLPGVTGCSQYTPLIKRNDAKRRRDNSESDCFLGTSKRARENSSDALQVWDFYCRYFEVLELQKQSSFQELEAGLSNPHDSRISKFHIALLKVLINELPAKVAIPNFDAGLMMAINEVTWPEVARRCILAMSIGTLCDSLTGVTSLEADALLLLDSTRNLFGPLPDKNATAEENSRAVGKVPEWAQVLKPVRKLPTNVGSRLRKCVYRALEKNPPQWAKEKLEHSISKEVYKGNAAGPTKRAVISVLDIVNQEKSHENPKQEKKENQTRVNTVADLAGYSSRCSEMVVQLANNMESKEYWELTVDERILLLKFLCDEVQNSSFLRDRMDHHASAFGSTGLNMGHLVTKAKRALDKKFGHVYRCKCLNLICQSQPHCLSCQVSFFDDKEFAVSDEPNLAEVIQKKDEPFLFEAIKEKFKTETSLKEVIEIGLIGSNGQVSFVPNRFHIYDPALSLDNLNERGEPSSSVNDLNFAFGESLNPVVRESSTRPKTGKDFEILQCLKTVLLDMDDALPDEAIRLSRSFMDRRITWRNFVKSANTLHEIIRATAILEDAIKKDYMRNDWWYWSSSSSTAKISTLSSLGLRIYALDSSILYEKQGI